MAYNNQEPQIHLGLNARKINKGQREDYPGKVMRESCMTDRDSEEILLLNMALARSTQEFFPKSWVQITCWGPPARLSVQTTKAIQELVVLQQETHNSIYLII